MESPDHILTLKQMTNGKELIIMKEANWWETANIACINHMIDCILENKEPIATAIDARRTLGTVLAAYKSSKEARVVYF
jgi:predicted dehydrogenase